MKLAAHEHPRAGVEQVLPGPAGERARLDEQLEGDEVAALRRRGDEQVADLRPDHEIEQPAAELLEEAALEHRRAGLDEATQVEDRLADRLELGRAQRR